MVVEGGADGRRELTESGADGSMRHAAWLPRCANARLKVIGVAFYESVIDVVVAREIESKRRAGIARALLSGNKRTASVHADWRKAWLPTHAEGNGQI